MAKFLDTCSLLHLQEKAFDGEIFYMSNVTLLELEDIKTSGKKDENVRYQARHATRLLDRHEGEYKVVNYTNDVVKVTESSNMPINDNHDMMICACARYCDTNIEHVIFVTDDICCKNIARDVFGLDVSSTWVNDDDYYKGYKRISGTSDEITYMMCNPDFLKDFVENEYLIIHNLDDGTDKEMRYTNGEFVTLKLPPSKYVKGKNSLQRCALDALYNQNIPAVAILGTYGSGKTYLATKVALYNINERGAQSRIVCVRSPWGEGREIGFLQGDFDQKTEQFFMPIQDQLEGGEFELEKMKQQGELEAQIPFYIKGRTYNDSIILCDESEDLTEQEIKLIGTRLGDNSKILFSGDFHQSLIKGENPLVKMCNELKDNPMFACVCLDEDVRSSASKMFADLFEKGD